MAHQSLESVDQKQLAAGIASCFGRPLVPDYFQTKNFFKIYATDSYRGMAVLTQENGVPYMDKFAVTSQAQGEGLGGALWARLLEENPKLFWRSRNKNPINSGIFNKPTAAIRMIPGQYSGLVLITLTKLNNALNMPRKCQQRLNLTLFQKQT